jgi:hypothetical protein
MNERRIQEVVVRTAETLSRRASLTTLGGAAIAAVARPAPVSAGKVSKKVRKTCKRQIGQCQSSVAAFCADAPEACDAALTPCCASFKGCKAAAVYECLIAALLALDAPEPN